MSKGPVLIELEEGDQPTPAEAPPIPDELPQGKAMQTVAALAARPHSRLARWFWGLLGSVIVFFLGLAAWNAVSALVLANPILGYAATALLVAFLF
ncbi:MAG: TIGR01620 family protein, partial [Pseudomonadota bacterium]